MNIVLILFIWLATAAALIYFKTLKAMKGKYMLKPNIKLMPKKFNNIKKI